MYCLYKRLGLKPGEFAINPLSGNTVFGVFPEIVHSHHHFPAGPIRLKYGKHFGPHRGYGISHIWAEHWRHIDDPHAASAAVIEHVTQIIHTGASIHCEFSQLKGAPRTMVCRGAHGIAILQESADGRGTAYYSVVTAFRGKANGPRIGAV